MATNLEFIKSETGTSVTSLSVTDCFSADYDVYQVLISKLNGLKQVVVEWCKLDLLIM